MLICVGIGQVLELLQQQGILENSLYRFDEVRLERRRVLLLRVARAQELPQLRVRVCKSQKILQR